MAAPESDGVTGGIHIVSAGSRERFDSNNFLLIDKSSIKCDSGGGSSDGDSVHVLANTTVATPPSPPHGGAAHRRGKSKSLPSTETTV